jgi:PAS domain S-box-containing protein
MNALEHSDDVLKLILDTAYEGIVLVDENGIIQEMNQPYLNLLGVNRVDAIGRHVVDVIENTRLHVVLETGIPERGHIQMIHGHEMIVHRLPIWKEGRVLGAIGVLIFEGINELYRILERTQQLARNTLQSKPQSYIRTDIVGTRVYTIDETIGQSHVIQTIKHLAKKAAKTPVTVLITGESGTGKEVLAQGIHYESPFANGPFISVNCAAIPEPLLEAELFGYEEGAFTGAKKGGKPGQIELADGGTLFLDEIGDMPPIMQAKLLRVLEEREIQRVGGLHKRHVNTRVIAATNCNLEDMVQSGEFREDLYYRLNIIRLHLPPLRERREDIPTLLALYVEQISRRLNRPPIQLTSDVVHVFMKYDWPGNIRELVHTVEVLVSLADSTEVTLKDFPPHLNKFITGESDIGVSPSQTRDEPGIIASGEDNVRNRLANHEMTIIQNALQEASGNKRLAAKNLGIHRSTLYQKMKRYHLM